MKFTNISAPRSGGATFKKAMKTLFEDRGWCEVRFMSSLVPPLHTGICLPELMDEHPDMKIIHLVRNGFDCVRSFMQDTIDAEMKYGFNENAHWWLNFMDINREDYFHMPRHIWGAMCWQVCMKNALKCRGNPNYFEISYELMVSNPEIFIEKVAEFLRIKLKRAEIEWFKAEIQNHRRRGLPMMTDQEYYEIGEIIDKQMLEVFYK